MTRRANALAGSLFWLGWLLAGLLIGLVLVTPLFARDEPADPLTLDHLIALFARDLTLRRTCLAAAVGLMVSACVFFQPAREGPDQPVPPSRRRRGSRMAGA